MRNIGKHVVKSLINSTDESVVHFFRALKFEEAFIWNNWINRQLYDTSLSIRNGKIASSKNAQPLDRAARKRFIKQNTLNKRAKKLHQQILRLKQLLKIAIASKKVGTAIVSYQGAGQHEMDSLPDRDELNSLMNTTAQLRVAHAKVKELRKKAHAKVPIPSSDKLWEIADKTRFRNGNLNFSKMAREFKTSYHTVQSWCTQFGIK